MFTGEDPPYTLQDFRVFGSPTKVLSKNLQDGNKISKWASRSWQGVYISHSYCQAGSIPVIYFPTTTHISPQYHVVYDEFFWTATSTSPTSHILKSFIWPLLDGYITINLVTIPTLLTHFGQATKWTLLFPHHPIKTNIKGMEIPYGFLAQMSMTLHQYLLLLQQKKTVPHHQTILKPYEGAWQRLLLPTWHHQQSITRQKCIPWYLFLQTL